MENERWSCIRLLAFGVATVSLTLALLLGVALLHKAMIWVLVLCFAGTAAEPWAAVIFVIMCAVVSLLAGNLFL
jgi:hypothetical protein